MDTLILQMYRLIMQTCNFAGDLTDNCAKKASLVVVDHCLLGE